MLHLLIQFVDAELTDFRWATCDETGGPSALNWQRAAPEELSAVTTQNPYPVIIVIPQQCVYLAQVELPEKAGRQLLSAIEYQVEDQLAQDIESQHFAIGDTSENPLAIAVVSRAIMERCMTLTRSHDLRLLKIVPELFLCPWSGAGVALTAGFDGYLLRYGRYQGLKCNLQTLPAMLDLIRRDVDFDELAFYGEDGNVSLAIEKFTMRQEPLDTIPLTLIDAPSIDLQQRDFQLSTAWRTLAMSWKWVALILALLLVVGTYNKAAALHNLEAELADVKQQQFQLVKTYLPKGTSPDANLKKLLIERMQQLQAGQLKQGFMKLMFEFTRARSKYPEVRISRIVYQGNKLSFEVSSSQLNDIEALLETVRKQGVNAKLLSLSIKPEQSSGRLELEGGNDV